MNEPAPNAARSALGNVIFMSRWLQAPLYVGLIVAQGVYVYQFMVELWHLVTSAPSLSENELMLIVLGLIDVVMIANLLIMVIVGGYETFVSRLNLQTFINAENKTMPVITAQVVIHITFVLSAFMMAWTDKISSGGRPAH